MTVARAHLIRIRELLAFLEREAVAAGADDPAVARRRCSCAGTEPG